jgi:DNA-directed RNA polymerase subunit N (RpoN/RPB10)
MVQKTVMKTGHKTLKQLDAIGINKYCTSLK